MSARPEELVQKALDTLHILQVENTVIKTQRDVLLEALERIAQLSMSQFHIPYDMAAEACNIARAAIKQAEGENT